jgi:ABC-2 type transport system permease protein
MRDFDPVQWRALVKAWVLINWRGTRGFGLGPAHRQPTGRSAIIGVFTIQSIAGLLMAFLIWNAQATFATAFLAFSYLGATVLMLLLLDYHAVVLSPDDYAILGYRPVSSRTFFAARLTSVSIAAHVPGVAFGIWPAAAWALRPGGSVAAALAGLLGVMATSFSCAMFLAVAYSALLQVLPADRLQRWLSYAQLVMAMVFYGLLLFLPRMLADQQVLESLVEKRSLVYLLPPAWPTSIVEAANGTATPLDWRVAPLNLLVPIGLTLAAAGRLSLRYAERLAVLLSSSHRASTSLAAGRQLVFAPQFHAVDLLVRAQFRVDQKFRLGVLAIVPLTLVYVIAGMADVAEGRSEGLQLLFFAIVFFPTMLRQTLTRSDAYRAAWVYFTSPVKTPDLIIAMRNVVVARFLLPYVVFVTLLLAVVTDLSVPALVVQAILLALLSLGLLTLDLTVNPALPFSIPPGTGERTSAILWTMAIAGGVIATLPWLFERLLRSFVPALALMAFLVGTNVLLHRALMRRLASLTARLEPPA